MKRLIGLMILPYIMVTGCAGTSYGNRHIAYSSEPIKEMETTCYHNGKKYSSGAVLGISGKKMKCGLGFWIDTSPKKQGSNSTPTLSALAALASRPMSSGTTNTGGSISASSDDSNTCVYSGKKYSSGATLTIEGVKNSCFFGNWIDKKQLNSRTQIGGSPFN